MEDGFSADFDLSLICPNPSTAKGDGEDDRYRDKIREEGKGRERLWESERDRVIDSDDKGGFGNAESAEDVVERLKQLLRKERTEKRGEKVRKRVFLEDLLC